VPPPQPAASAIGRLPLNVAEPTAAERVTYNLEHAEQFHPAKSGVSPDSAQPDKREDREVYGREHSDHRGQQ
jgi:hypothetical protein